MNIGAMGLLNDNDYVKEKSHIYPSCEDEVSPLAASEFEMPAENDFSLYFASDKNMNPKESTYVIARDLFARCLAFMYFLSFLGHFNQDVSLVGQEGVWPADVHLSEIVQKFAEGNLDNTGNAPGVFVLLPIADLCIRFLAAGGMVMSAMIVFTGIIGCGSCITLWIIQYSLVSLMANLPKHNADLLLLEAGFVAIFLFSPFLIFEKQGKEWNVPLITRWAFRFLVYRVMFCAGVSKIRGSAHWFDNTAFKYLLQSVSLPNPFTIHLYNFFDKYPVFNGIATNGLIFIECVASVFLLVPIRSCSIIGGLIAVFYALCFNFIGNFGYFYMLLGSCALFCFDDACLKFVKYSPFASFRVSNLGGYDASGDDASEHIADVEEDGGDVDDYKGHEGGIGSKFLRALRYESKKSCLREALFSKTAFGLEDDDERHQKIQDVIQHVIICCIAILGIDMIFGRSNLALKACVIFFLAVLMQVQCDVIGTDRSYYLVSGTLFALHVWLIAEMMTNGIRIWSMWLWLAITELQVGLCRSLAKLNHITKILMQSIVVMSTCYYSLPLVVRSINHSHPDVGFKAPLGIVNSYNGFGILPEVRHELLIQGTQDTAISTNTNWKTYELHGIPGDVNAKPLFLPGYNYELDNLIRDVIDRDLAKHPKAVPVFMLDFLRALLHNKKTVTNLLATNPFVEAPPKYVRVVQYAYRYAGPNENCWYTRKEIAQVIPPLTLQKGPERRPAEKPKEVPQENEKAPEHPVPTAPKTPSKVVHVFHEMPAARNIHGVPLEMAGNLVNEQPVTDSLMLTRV
ncbi:lipase maturation factor [Babesia gibsoni]|uniref:Lipase maturation factor n=1 Tax=Babesia gibsoni TaxID=33632 RepID=A0AAD8LK29_BABGI|nr:lipase maturation factor [Babesia gibsoni]